MDPSSWDDVDVGRSQCCSINIRLRDVHQPTEQRCGGEMYDLSGTTHSYEVLRLANQQEYKNYLIRLKNKDDLQTIRFVKAEIHMALEKIAKLFILDVRTVVLNYPMKCNDGSEKYITVEKTRYMSEALEGFYCQTEELSTLLISTKTVSKKPPRKIKHSENCFKQFLK